MPSDIRSFFGGKPAASPPKKAAKDADKPKKRGRTRKVVSDDEDDDPPVSKLVVTPKKKKAPSPEPEMEETTASSYFGKGNKPKRTEDARHKTRGKPQPAEDEGKKANGAKATPKRGAKANGTASTRSSARKGKKTNYAEFGDDDFPDDDLDEGEDNARAEMKVGRRAGDDYEEASEEDAEAPLVPKKATKANGKQQTVKDEDS